MNEDTEREDEAQHQRLVRIALSMYLGERCKYCFRKFDTLDDLQEAVWVGQHKHGRIAHEKCYLRNIQFRRAIMRCMAHARRPHNGQRRLRGQREATA